MITVIVHWFFYCPSDNTHHHNLEREKRVHHRSFVHPYTVGKTFPDTFMSPQMSMWDKNGHLSLINSMIGSNCLSFSIWIFFCPLIYGLVPIQVKPFTMVYQTFLIFYGVNCHIVAHHWELSYDANKSFIRKMRIITQRESEQVWVKLFRKRVVHWVKISRTESLCMDSLKGERLTNAQQ